MEDNNPNRAEAERLLGIAEKLLQSRDLNGSREFAILAQEAEPLLEGSDQILAVVDSLLAAENGRVNNHPDWYAILQIDPRRSSSDHDLIKRQYRRLALLLHPDKNRFALADQAFKLVADAWDVLSTPAKKSLFDGEINLFYTKVDLNNHQEKLTPRRGSGSGSGAGGSGGSYKTTTFWTACPYCYGLYEYPRVYEECCIRCQNCRRAFHAAKIPQLPPIVPGRDEYYCCWGFFPMGFVNEKESDGGAAAAAAATATDSSKFPSWMPPIFPAAQQTAVNGGSGAAAAPAAAAGGSGMGRGAGKRENAAAGAAKVPFPVQVQVQGGVGGSQDGAPKKRGRGRPRKNPLP